MYLLNQFLDILTNVKLSEAFAILCREKVFALSAGYKKKSDFFLFHADNL